MKHLRKFEEYDLGHRFSTPEEEEITPLELDEPTGDETGDIYSDEEGDEEGDEYCASCEDDTDEDSSEEPTRTWGDENIYVERVVSFRQFEAKKNAKGKTPKNEKEKELAAKYPPKDKITKGDFIAAAIENKKGKSQAHHAHKHAIKSTISTSTSKYAIKSTISMICGFVN